MIRLVVAALVLGFVVWGVARPPGRAFSWTMYAGSSKPFLWVDDETGARVPTYAELHLAPDSHYLTRPDLDRLVLELEPRVRLQGLILGSRGSWKIGPDGTGRNLTVEPLEPGEDRGYLVATLQRLGCRQP